MEFTIRYTSPLGGITLASDGDALTGLWFDGQKVFPDALPAGSGETRAPVFDEAVKWLDAYFSGREPDFTPKLRMQGTEFRKTVWEILLGIPYGRTVSYGEIAERIARQRGIPRMSAQAVGGAVGHNPIALIVPCHRVVGADGSLTGYAGGVDRKAWLLSLEGADKSALFVPKGGTAL